MTDAQLSWLRDEIGEADPDDTEGPDLSDDALNDRFDELGGSVVAVALSVLRRRLTDLRLAPTSATLTGVGSVSFGENIKALERQIASLSSIEGDPTDPENPDPDGGPRPFGEVQLVRTRGR